MLACGCELKAGRSVTTEEIERHRDHTTECLLFWELLLGIMKPDDDTKFKVAEARLAVDKFVENYKVAQLARIQSIGGNPAAMDVLKALGMI